MLKFILLPDINVENIEHHTLKNMIEFLLEFVVKVFSMEFLLKGLWKNNFDAQ